MRLLVLGGTSFVGRAAVTAAAERGWPVTTFNRGRAGWAHPDAERLHGDRTRPADLQVLAGRTWDAVVDTWAGAPRAVRDSAALLAGAAERYLYVSSRSVYRWPPVPGSDERAPTVEASPDAADGDYATGKRGGELAAVAAYGDRALLARAGLILGPHEDVGRLPWWLLRVERGGPVLAPGPADLPLQYVDARDLAQFLLHAASTGLGGPVDVVSRPGHTTMGGLLDACVAATAPTAADPQLVWLEPEQVLAAGLQPWRELPVWVPAGSDLAGLHDSDVSRAYAAGLRCRPVEETVEDTWAWLLTEDRQPALRPDVPAHGIDPAKEQAILRSLGHG